MCGFLNFDGRVAVVTGGARGIGLSIARALVDHGARVHVFDVSPGEEGDSTGYRFHRVDIADTGSVASAVAQLPEPVSLLVNNAGITRDRTLVNMTDEEWDAVLSVNLTGAFRVTRALAPAPGAWAWGDRVVWQFGRGYGAADVHGAFVAAVSGGIRLIDTAEVYGSGRSERFVGEFVRGLDGEVLVATKFFPWPWRLVASR